MQLQCNRLLACARCKLWWMTPSWGTKAGDLPPETQFVLVELAKGGPYAVMLPLIDQDTYRATLRPSTRCSFALLDVWGSASDLIDQQVHLNTYQNMLQVGVSTRRGVINGTQKL